MRAIWRHKIGAARRLSGLALLGVLLAMPAAWAGSYTVTVTDDSGPGTLRQAILDADVGGGGSITFAIPGGGVQTIQPLTPLPALTAAVTIDGTTQPGYAGMPRIELDGSQADSSDAAGLRIFAGGCTVRGLIVNRFGFAGIDVARSGSVTVRDCFLGTDFSGSNALANTFGVLLEGVSGCTVRDCIVSGNATGVGMIGGASGNTVEGCDIGTDFSGSYGVGNLVGVDMDGAGNNTVTDCLIAGNLFSGVLLEDGTSAARITNDTIGLDVYFEPLPNGDGIEVADSGDNILTGSLIAGNGVGIRLHGAQTGQNRVEGNLIQGNGYGIDVSGGANDNVIGGSGAGNTIVGNGADGVTIHGAGTAGHAIQGNEIGGNGQYGVSVYSADNAVTSNHIYESGVNGVFIGSADGLPFAVRVPILSNSIHDNGDLGILLDTDGRDGGNHLQPAPVLSQAVSDASTTSVIGTLTAAPNTTFTVQMFANPQPDPSGDGEGQTLVGTLTVTTDGGGHGAINTTLSASSSGQFLSATATDPDGNTSQFSNTVIVGQPGPAPVLTDLSPATALPGSGGFTLTATGRNFVANSVVRWNGADRATQFVNATTLTAQITAADVAAAGTSQVTVFNPAPNGGLSNGLPFTVSNPMPTLTAISPNHADRNGPGFTLTATGRDFVPGSVVRWNGLNRATTFVNATTLTAAIPQSDLTQARVVQVTVFTPGPGGGESAPLPFTVVGSLDFTVTPAAATGPAGGTVFFRGTVKNNTGGPVTLNGLNIALPAGSKLTPDITPFTQNFAGILETDGTISDKLLFSIRIDPTADPILYPGTANLLGGADMSSALAHADFSLTVVQDRTAPTTTIQDGPAEGAIACGSTVVFRYTGSDNLTPVASLRYEYSLDGAPFSAPLVETSVTLMGLADGAHTFVVKAVDEAGNIDPIGATRHFTVSTTAPVISGAAISAITDTSAHVSWTTDKGADTIVDYRVQGATDWTSTPRDPSLVTAHSVTLTGLLPDMAYEYRVRSADGCGNEASSAIQPFHTLADTTPPSATIVTGPTGVICRGDVVFVYTGRDDVTPSTSLKYRYRVDGGDWMGPFASTTVTLTGLADGTHTFEVEAIDGAGNISAPASFIFTLDSRALAVTGVQATAISATAATIRWQTNKLATSQVEYRLTTDTTWTTLPADLTPVTDHRVALTGLQKNAGHTYRVRSKDTCGTEIVSPDATFTTTPDTTPPTAGIASGPADGGIACDTTVQFCWTGTDNSTDTSALLYSYTLDGAAFSAFSAETCHTFTGLAVGLHTVQVRAQDASGNVSAPAGRTFYVNLDPPAISNLVVTPRDYKATVVWNTSQPATGQVEYGLTAAYGSTSALDGDLDGAHSIVLTGLTPLTTYHYRVHSSNGCRETVSADATFTTTDILKPNLAVTDITLPAETAALGQIDVTWTVQNLGPGDAFADWKDTVYLSPTATFDPATAVKIGSYAAPGQLSDRDSYTQTQTLTMPLEPAGHYYLVVVADGENAVAETSETDNALARPVEFLKVSPFVAAPDQIALSVKPTVTFSGTIQIGNLSGAPLTGLTANIEGALPNVAIQFTPPSSLDTLGTAAVPFTVTASDESVLTGAPIIHFHSAEGPDAVVTLNLTIVPRRPQLVINPTSLATGMTRGRQTLVEATITNTGSVAATALHVSVPAAPWLSLVSPADLGDLAPGATATVVLSLKPALDLPLGPYTGLIALNGTNSAATLGFKFTCVSDAKGDFKAVAQDEYTFFADDKPPVAGATITLKDAQTGAVVANGVTDADGVFTAKGIPEGFYNLEATADKHGTANLTIGIKPGQENIVYPFLPRQLVMYNWNVIPANTPDQYVVDLEATFETHVPAPVVTVSPTILNLSTIAFNADGKAVVNYTITNHGLIAANGVQFGFDNDSNYHLVPLMTDLGSLAPLSTIIVPVTITRTEDNEAVFSPHTVLQQQSMANGGCYIHGRETHFVNCSGKKYTSTEVLVKTPIDCPKGSVIGGTSGGGTSGGGTGGGPALNTPTIISLPLPCLCNPKVDPVYHCLNFAPAFEKILEPIKNAVKNIPGGIFKLEFDLKEADVCYTFCCTPDGTFSFGTKGEAEFEITGENKLPIGGLPPIDQNIKAVPINTPHFGTLYVSGNVKLLVGGDFKITGSLKASIKAGCGQDWCIDASGSLAGDAQFGDIAEASLTAKDAQGNTVGTLKVTADATISTGISDTISYDCEKGFNNALCFKGVYVQVVFKAKLVVNDAVEGEFDIANVKEYIIDPYGDCKPESASRLTSSFQASVASAVQSRLRDAQRQANKDFLRQVMAHSRLINHATQADAGPVDEGVCAHVRVHLSQDVTLTRTAFKASLEVINSPQNVPLQNVKVTLDIQDSNHQPINGMFGITGPVLTGVTAVDGTGKINSGATGDVVWTITPTRDAAPTEDTQYYVGGTLSYTQNGETITTPLVPAPITVKPDPLLQFHYFWQRDIYADDPFTPLVEPSEPFSLGLLVSNKGNGTARNLSITSAQPKIVDNDKGLLIDFKLIGSQVNTDPISPSFTVNFGNVDPQSTVAARFLLTSSLQGKFSDYTATFKHVDDLGSPKTSLIDSVDIHELEHVVRVDLPTDDGKPDFLANDVPDVSTPVDSSLPDTLWSSDGTTAPVTARTNATVDGQASNTVRVVHLTVAGPPVGWLYIRTDDPALGNYKLARVVRSDGRELKIDSGGWGNVWTTFRSIRLEGQNPYPQYRLYLFDKDSTGAYTLYYTQKDPVNAPVGALKNLSDGTQVSFGTADGGDGLGGGGGTGTGTGGTGGLSGPVAVTAVFPDALYLEAADRSAGIKAVLGAGLTAPQVGDNVLGSGTIKTGADGERYIDLTALTVAGRGPVAPLEITTKGFYGGDSTGYDAATGVGQKGMAGGVGLDPVGLLAVTLGRVTGSGGGAVTIDDGYGRPVKALLPVGVAAPTLGAFAAAAGPVSVEKHADGLYPVLRVRTAADVFSDLSGLQGGFLSPPNTLRLGDNLFSLPGLPVNPAPPSVLSSLDPGDGSALIGRLNRFDAATQSEVYWDGAGVAGPFGDFLLGEGYRLNLNAGESGRIGFSGYRTDFADLWVSLPRLGVTRIGTPFPVPVDWGQVSVSDGTQTVPLRAAAQTQFPPWLSSKAQYFDSAAQVSRILGLSEDNPDSTSLAPWLGYWVTGMKEQLALIIPAHAGVPATVSLSPNTAPAGGSDFTLTVNGANFTSGSVVRWNGAARPTTWVSPTQLVAAIPASDIAFPGTASVTVVVPGPYGGASAPPSPFTVMGANPAPTITGLSPASAVAGQPDFVLTVSGTGFLPATAVTFNGSAVTPTSLTATAITFTVHPADIPKAGVYLVTVINPAPGGGTATAKFLVAGPNIDTLSPASSVLHTETDPPLPLTVTGAGFVPGTTVSFDGQALTPTATSATSLTVTIPSGLLTASRTASVLVTNPGGQTSNSRLFPVGNPKLTVTEKTTALGAGAFRVDLTVSNSGATAALGVTLTRATLSGKGGTPIPQAVGRIEAGQSATVSLMFSGATQKSLSVTVTYTGGSVSPLFPNP